MLYDLVGAFQRSAFGDPRHIAAVPLHAKLEVLVWIEPRRIDGELCHTGLLSLPSDLLDLDNDKLRGLKRRKPHNDVDDAVVDVSLRRGLTTTLHEVGIL